MTKSLVPCAGVLSLVLLVSSPILAAPVEGASKPSPPAAADAAPARESGAASEGPKLTIDKREVDVGDVTRGDVAVAVFEVRNSGDRVLKILDARPGCGCTVASFDKTIEPGKVGKITANVKTDAFRGPIAKSLSVTTNDPSNSMLSLEVKANVVGSVEILPSPFLALPTTSDFEYQSQLLIRRDRTEQGELAITDVTTSVPWLTASARRVTEAEPATQTRPNAAPGDWILEVSAKEDAPAITGSQHVTFKTGLHREPTVTIPMAVSFMQPMLANPTSLVMVVPEGTSTAKGAFTLGTRPGLSHDPVTARAEPDSFSVTLEPTKQRRYKANVVWNAKDGTAPLDGTVTLLAGKESLTVPVRVLKRPMGARGAVTSPDADTNAAGSRPGSKSSQTP